MLPFVANTRKIDYGSVQQYYDQGHTPMECVRKYMGGTATWCKAIKKGWLLIDPKRQRKKPDPSQDLAGRVFHDLTVIERAKIGKRNSYWKCVCKCGNIKILRTGNLLSGATKGCGCRRKRRGKAHHHWMGYKGISLTFWKSIVNACKTRSLGRTIKFEITMEQAWNLFISQDGKCSISGIEIVLSPERGERTASLDRKDSSKDYELDNVQWVHKRVNLMKGALSDSEFITWCKIISKNHE